jgi:hypothetical protein
MTIRNARTAVTAGLVLAVVLAASAQPLPDARELLAQATAALAPPTARIRYEVRALDGKGGEARSTLLFAAEGPAGRTIAYVKKSGTMAEAGLYAATVDGKPHIFTRAKGKTRTLDPGKANGEFGTTGLRIEDLLPRRLPDKVEVVTGVIYHGVLCWIVQGESAGKGGKPARARYWVRKTDPVVVQIEWRDKKDRAVRQVAIVPGKAGEGHWYAERMTVSAAEGGAWTELVAKAAAFDAFPDLGDKPEAVFDDPAKLEARWP